MQQVVFNLVENALKFTDAPGTVGLTTRLEPTAWALEVWDTGRGIEPEKIEELFEPFRQASPADALRGWGLGLNICRSIVQAHEGRIVVSSEVGSGSRFTVLLPLLTSSREPVS
jgi:signal transduction histidine kinase